VSAFENVLMAICGKYISLSKEGEGEAPSAEPKGAEPATPEEPAKVADAQPAMSKTKEKKLKRLRR